MIVEVHDLWKRYGRLEALRGLTFEIAEGNAFALVGPNGAGKTTTIQTLVNLLEPSSGSARILGVDSRALSARELADIGYVSENHELPGRLTVEEYFDYLRPFYPRWDRALETSMRRDMPLPTTRRIRHLSHGMRIKMSLACALSSRPRLLILDEPSPGSIHQNLDDRVEKPGFGPADVGYDNERRRAEGARTVLFPLRVTGLLPNSRLLVDHSEVTLIGRDGRGVYHGTGNDLEVRATNREAIVHHGLRVPGAVYNRIESEPLEVQLDYWFTVFRADATYALPARGGEQRMPGVGWCTTKVDDAGTRVLFNCLNAGERPSCLSVFLEHRSTGQRNPEVSMCAPDYSPYPGHVLPDAVSRFAGRLPFYDPSGLIRYPGQRTPRFLLARMGAWVLAPLAALILAIIASNRWSAVTWPAFAWTQWCLTAMRVE